MKNKRLLIGTLIFATAAASTYLFKLRIDQIRREIAETEEIEVIKE